MGNNLAPSETANELQMWTLCLLIYHDKITSRRHRPPLEVSPSSVRIAAIRDAMNDVLRPCQNMSAYDIIDFVGLIFDFLVNRLMRGDASDLTQNQVPVQWQLTALNDLLAVVRIHCTESLTQAAEDIKKDLVERLALLAVYCNTCEWT